MAKLVIKDNYGLHALKKFLNDKTTPNTIPEAQKALKNCEPCHDKDPKVNSNKPKQKSKGDE